MTRLPGPPEGRTRGPVTVVSAAWGLFPESDPLHPSFRPGRTRLKMTLRIDPGEAPPDGLLASLETLLPSLPDHRCGGESGLRPGLDARHVDDGPHDGVEVAHLIEHVLIDVQHRIARTRSCSGVTCAWASQPTLFDLFVECPEEAVGRLSGGIAVDLVGELLDGRPVDPRYLCLADVARAARDHAGEPVETAARPLERAWGKPLVGASIEDLRSRGFLDRYPASFNFSGAPLHAYIQAAAPGALP